MHSLYPVTESPEEELDILWGEVKSEADGDVFLGRLITEALVEEFDEDAIGSGMGNDDDDAPSREVPEAPFSSLGILLYAVERLNESEFCKSQKFQSIAGQH